MTHPAANDVCRCGDYRRQHTNGEGRCRVCQPLAGSPAAPWDGCHRFTPPEVTP